jgi:hydroxyacylglutathione hydrolase
MEQVAENVYLLDGRPKYGINVYLMNGVLIDAGSRLAEKRILTQLEGHDVTAHALTHAHPDHQGSSHAVCEKLNIPLYCGRGDADAMESGDWEQVIPNNWSTRPQHKFWTGPPHPVTKRLQEGDDVAGFTIVEVPGHAPGHVAFWRESDRLLILGDVLNGMNLLTTKPGLHEPLKLWTPDPEENRRSIKKLADLKPNIACFGHGPPMHNAAEKFESFANSL